MTNLAPSTSSTGTATGTKISTPVTRKKSPETALKQEMRTINKELDGVAKTIAEFADIKKAFDGAEARKVQLTTKLDSVKGKLRKALDLD